MVGRLRRRFSTQSWLSSEGKEHLGGFTIIAVPDLEAALRWAGKLAKATTLPIEVRPLHD
jgi:hypothetical protein